MSSSQADAATTTDKSNQPSTGDDTAMNSANETAGASTTAAGGLRIAVPTQQGGTGGANSATTTATSTTTTSVGPGRKRKAGSSGGGGGGGAMTPVTPTFQQDAHPYARGAVIEVWHQPAAAASVATTEAESLWWSEPDSSEDETEQKANDNNKDKSNTASSSSSSSTTTRTIRLCDIIDRAQYTESKTGTTRWRYYIHYRDFNRRMDEWIESDRIASPPSVGNAKARALKREAEKAEKAAQMAAAGRGQRRRSQKTPIDPTMTASGGEDDTTDGRRTRLSRRKSAVTDDDDATVLAANEGTSATTATGGDNDEVEFSDKDPTMSGSGSGATTTMAPKQQHAAAPKHKEIVVAGSDVTTHTVGEHVVATLQAQELDEHEGLDEASLREHEEVTKVKNVAFMELGYFQMETWYFSPLPKELIGPSGFLPVLYVCEFTLNMFARKSELQRFQARLPVNQRHPPGNEIYRRDDLAMFEIDGQEEKIYSQNLCYIAKLFLDHKTLYFDVDPFLFYVLCEVDERGYHPVGYFSKEKYSDVGYNLACILTFPAHQRKGYGRFLIAFSYELSKKEEKVGSPEKPMSDLGQQAYKPYWASTIVDFLLHQSTAESSLSVMDISKRTSIMAEDIVFTLNQLGLLKMMNGVYFIAAEENLLSRLALKYPIKKPFIDPSALHWTPFLTDIKRDKFSIHSKKASVIEDTTTTAAVPITGVGRSTSTTVSS